MTEALLGLFVSAFLSATLLPGGSEAVLAALLALGNVSIYSAVGVATLGNTLGSCVNWAMGRFFAHYRAAKWFPLRPEKFQAYQNWYAKWGIWSLLLSWVPIIGDPLTVIAGVARTRLIVFFPVVLVAKLGRYLVVAGVIKAFW